MALLFLIGTMDRCPPELEFAGGADADRRRTGGLVREELLAGGVVPHSLVFVGRHYFRALIVDYHAITAFRVGWLALHYDRPDVQLHQVLAGISAGVRFLDAVGQRALASHRDTSRSRRRRARKNAGRHHEDIFRTQWIAFWIAFLEQDPRGQGAATQNLPISREWIERRCLRCHVHAQDPVAVGFRHQGTSNS